MSDNRELIESVLRIPIRHEKEEMSLIDLTKESGYYEKYTELDEARIRDGLNEFPNYLVDWWRHADNSRADGWNMFEREKGVYVVRFDKENERTFEFVFDEKVDACAKYITVLLSRIKDRFPK